ncbi:DVU_1553 family AMP-dependent CoA ligase [Halodesulfovibrio marinisediminis]|uniref:Phenylacetate-coenzyme A ligase PaaK, adenylate-forming domain family n=1 Tax=Halodesulfovibrio marinisediminis DSM 17456 TaxID=1121457 RepID=A0A1N6GWJ9_9BACT|nr:AMP-binding protein [Halodesulfovibrio marinisediminis]SIO11908.1 Phenylacetate-coenzyme A ligase PaaK, adenylate-forming domain family [Halodesulfovibrio marinisediminis DSM 17456]
MQTTFVRNAKQQHVAWVNPLDTQAQLDMGAGASVRPFSSSQIKAWQLNRLNEVCNYAQENGGFYAKHFQAIDVAFTSREEFANLPRTTADDIREAPLEFLCTSQDDIARVVTLTTSGSTGKPKRLFFTQDELDETTEFYNHGMQCLVDAGDTVLALLPAPKPDSVGALLADGLHLLGATPILHQDPDDVVTSLTMFKEHAPDCVVGTAAHVLALIKLWEHDGKTESPVKSVLLCWDASSSAIRNFIEKTWDCRVHTHWGMTETGLGGAVNCPYSNGMHLRETNIYVEITDPETGSLLPDGERGEIVVTTLSRKGMPLIRYRTGDESHIMTNACPCDSPLRRLSPNIRRIAKSKDTPYWFQYITPTAIDGQLLSIPNFLAQQAQYRVAPNTLEVTVDMSGDSSQHLSSIKELLCNFVSPLHIAPDVLCLPGRNDGKISIGFAKRKICVE